MNTSSALIGFTIAAALLTITPGLDTALVLRTASVEGGRQAMSAGTGVVTGVLAWGVLVALGLGTLLAISETAYFVLRICGALYLLWLGLQMIRSALRSNLVQAAPGAGALHAAERMVRSASFRWFARGVMTNLLNPKVGVFYVSFLPQFIPHGANVLTFSILLASIHAVMGLIWFGTLTLATSSLSRALRRPRVVRILDGLTGLVLIGFGLRLLLDRRMA